MEIEVLKNELKDKPELYVDVISEDQIANFIKDIDARDYSKDLKKRILDKIKDFKEIKKREHLKVYKFEQDTGTKHVFMVLKKNIKQFDLQYALRKNLNDSLKESKMTLVRTKLSAKSLEPSIISLLIFLSKILEWKAPVYGKKVKEEASEKKKDKASKKLVFETHLKDAEVIDIKKKYLVLAEANNLVRTLATLPTNYLTPAIYHQILQERAYKNKFILRFYDKDKLEKMNAGAFSAVLRADSESKGGLAHLSYKPKNKSQGKICLVGKGLCFDTGGYNIKTGNYMFTMHRDMTGSAVALALFESLIRMDLPYEVHCVLAIAENLVSEKAFKPNEVVTAMNGMSIEVVDTDAEGRMVLSDALCFASDLKPNLIIDFATLTGAAVRSIGTVRSAVFSNNRKLLQLAQEAGDATGERVWGFPIGEDYREMIKSEVADIKQCMNSPGPDHILAATFLSEFVEESVPWLHVDLSSEENTGGLGIVATDVTGFGVKLGYDVVERFMASTEK